MVSQTQFGNGYLVARWVNGEPGRGHDARVTEAVSRRQRQPGRSWEQLKRGLLETEMKAA